MRLGRQLHRFASLAALPLALLLGACGGGGGSDSTTISWNPAPVTASSIEGNEVVVDTVTPLSIAAASNTTVFIAAEADAAVVLAINGEVGIDTLNLHITLRGDLAPGAHPTAIRLHACLDERCSKEVKGSPVSMQIAYTVRPNIAIDPTVALQRTGREAAPSVVVPVTVPAEAGAVSFTVSGAQSYFDVSYDAAGLHIGTHQDRAGTYTLKVTLRGAADPNYVRSTDITYIVIPPAGGEQALAVTPGQITLFLLQGQVVTQRFTVTRPTWTDAFDPPVFSSSTGMVTMADLGGDQYELTIDARGRPLGGDYAVVRFSAGATGGTAILGVSPQVVSAFYPTAGYFNVALSATSSPADLHLSTPVVTVDSVPARWTAVSTLPWLRLLRATGITGVDTLDVEIDPTLLSATDFATTGTIDVSIDRPGTLSVPLPVGVYDTRPSFQRGTAALVGDRGRIYIEGVTRTDSSAIGPGILQVTGAVLYQARYLTDNRFAGDVSVVALDVTDAVAGQPIVVRALGPLVDTAFTIAVEAPTRVPTGYLSLPYGAYRPPQYAPTRDALYFAGSGTVYRWAHDASGWTMTQVAVPGATDVALRTDAQRLHAVGGTSVRALDPATLATIGNGTLSSTFFPGNRFDETSPAAQNVLAYAADGRAMAAVYVAGPAGERLSRRLAWIAAPQGEKVLGDLIDSPGPADPGSGFGSDVPAEVGVAVVASANGRAIAGTFPDGGVMLYRADARQMDVGPRLPAGLPIVAIANDAQRFVRSDGVVVDSAGVSLGGLASIVPFSHVAGGYGMTQDGRYGLVYGYRIVAEAGGDRARDAALWVVDMANVPTTPLASAPIVATIVLPDAVGCTGPLATGETCRHAASVTVAPGGGSAFVLGPRGIAAVALPAAVTVAPEAMRAPAARALRGPTGTSGEKSVVRRVLGTSH